MPDLFDLVELAPGIYGAVSEIAGPAVGNAAIIDTGDKTVVVDSFMVATAAAELHREAVRLTGRSAFLLANTHWHSDHTWGNQEFAGTPIAATARTVELLVADAPADLAAYEAELDGMLATLRLQAASEDAAAAQGARRRLAGMEHLRAAAPGLRITLPNLIVADSLTITGTRPVELHTYGGGHTDSDLFAWVPAERTLIAGDLCWNAIHPRIHDGHPAAWAGILDRLARLGPRRVHPGHGRPGGPELIADLAPYLRTVAGYVAAAQVRAAGPLPPPPGSEGWAGVERMRAGVAALAARTG